MHSSFTGRDSEAMGLPLCTICHIARVQVSSCYHLLQEAAEIRQAPDGRQLGSTTKTHAHWPKAKPLEGSCHSGDQIERVAVCSVCWTSAVSDQHLFIAIPRLWNALSWQFHWAFFCVSTVSDEHWGGYEASSRPQTMKVALEASQ